LAQPQSEEGVGHVRTTPESVLHGVPTVRPCFEVELTVGNGRQDVDGQRLVLPRFRERGPRRLEAGEGFSILLIGGEVVTLGKQAFRFF
jgi:hypothetical protein